MFALLYNWIAIPFHFNDPNNAKMKGKIHPEMGMGMYAVCQGPFCCVLVYLLFF